MYPCAATSAHLGQSKGHRICEMDPCVHGMLHGKCNAIGGGGGGVGRRRGNSPDLEVSKLPSRGASDVYNRGVHEASVNCHCSQCNLGHTSAIYLPSASGAVASVEPVLDSRVILGEIELEEESSLSGSSGSGIGVASAVGAALGAAVDSATSIPGVGGTGGNYCHHCCHHQNQLDCHSSEVDEILTEMKFITNRMRREDESNDIVMEYRLCALVIDRCCLYLFTTVTVISTLLCISKAPHLIV